MFVLPSALAALRAYRQFIVYKIVPSRTVPNKLDKLPIDWRTGRVADAHDPAIWLDVDTAAATAAAFGDDYGVGFVFTKADPFWFIDIDSCAEAGGWSATANALCGRFAGAAVEVSVSGNGLHIIGTGTAPSPRRIKYAHYFDLYTDGRFCALTGTNIIGDAATTHDEALAVLVRDYLTPDASDDAGWTTQPCEGWRGPEDDAQLIARAMRSKSGVSAFNSTRASFADLWEGNVAVLTAAYPDDHGTRPYDASRADSGLAQHLAFWTGKDCERILRLMRLSALVRDKWQREDYMRTTILLAVARQYDVLSDKAPEPLASPGESRMVEGETYLTADNQIKLFAGCTYVRDQHKVLIPGGFMLKPDQFKVMYGGYSFPMDTFNERVTRNAWEAFTESQTYRSPRADTLCFRPDVTPGAIINSAGTTMANVWWPIETPRAQGDAGPFTRHLAKLFPNEDDRMKLVAYMAAVVQYPGVKFQWAPLVQGVAGNGKTLLVTAIARAVGDRYTHLPNAAELGANGAKFTAWLYAKLFIGIEEIYTADKSEVMEALKPLITNMRVEIQAKGHDQVTGDNRANFFACSNHLDAIRKTTSERRWGIFYTAQQTVEDLTRDGMDGNYFPDLYDWFEGRNRYAGHAPGFAIINDYLRTFAIPDAMNPATLSQRAPETTSTAEAIRLSVGAIEQEILEAIEQEIPGFAGGWISSMALDKLLVRLNAERRVPPGKRREMLVALGYDWHPALTNGRTNNSVSPDGGKPRLFAKRGHPINAITDGRVATKMYSQTQTQAQTAVANFGS